MQKDHVNFDPQQKLNENIPEENPRMVDPPTSPRNSQQASQDDLLVHLEEN